MILDDQHVRSKNVDTFFTIVAATLEFHTIGMSKHLIVLASALSVAFQHALTNCTVYVKPEVDDRMASFERHVSYHLVESHARLAILNSFMLVWPTSILSCASLAIITNE